ncbi:MAG: PepSY domain-containing protein [Caldicoprobacterales bacterium]
MELDDLYDDDDRPEADEAKAIALRKTGGGTIVEFESDDDEYEVEIKIDGKKYKVEIDAYTGKILDYEIIILLLEKCLNQSHL